MAASAVNFVHIIQQYPCLYNNRLAEYSRKDITDEAWSAVAEKTNTSVSDCQLKWKNIRNGFVRSLKPTPCGSATKQKKLYYLYEELQFLLPFIKAVIHTDEPLDTEDTCCEPKSNTSRKAKVRKVTTEADKAFIEWIKKREPKNDSPRKMFLLSLLPDVEKLSEERMRQFRIKMLLLLEELQTEAT